MDQISGYLHVLEGRLRVRVPQVKRSPEEARELQGKLAALPEFAHVEASPVTGNVLVHYDADELDHGRVIEIIRSTGYHPKLPSDAPGPLRATHSRLERAARGIPWDHHARHYGRRLAEDLALGAAATVIKIGLRLLVRRLLF